MTQPFSIITLTSRRSHLLLTAPDETAIDRLKTMAVQPGSDICMIDERLPLLANLNVMENIALGRMYHDNMSLRACRRKLKPAVMRLGLESVLEKRKEFLTRHQHLKVHLLRCVANECGHIVLDSPARSDCDILERALNMLDAGIFLWVCCLSSEQDVYSSLGYATFDLGVLA